MKHSHGLSVDDIIVQAWKARFARDIEECRGLVASLRQRLAFMHADLDSEALKTLLANCEREHVAQLVCLIASLQRFDTGSGQALNTLGLLEARYHHEGWPLPFQLCFQKGLCEFADARFSTALDLFLGAKSAARGPLEQSYALANSLFCLEALGMPYGKTKGELEKRLAQAKINFETAEIDAQLASFELRTLFRSGRIDEIKRAQSRGPRLTQADYYRLWLAEIPFHEAKGENRAEDQERFFLATPSFYQKAYRVRTLQGLLHDDDLKYAKESELADRVYLWTWRWLTGAESLSIPRIMALLRHVDLLDLASRLTSEDFQLIRNSLLWLGLFDANSAAAVQKMTEAMRPVHADDFALFAFEKNVIAYLYALRDHRADEAQDLRKILESDPLFNRSGLYLADLIKSSDSGVKPAGPLKELILQVRCFNDSGQDFLKGVVVDLKTYEISADGGQKKVVSQPLCFAIESLFRKNPLEFEELLRVCFGIAQYDALLHASKIFNLVARMKACLPDEIILTSKGGKLYASGSWSQVHFVRPHALASALQNQPEWRALVRRRVENTGDQDERWIKPAQILKKLSGQPTLKRHELEALTGKSRSTANRIISRWVSQGILKKTGRAKNTVYSFHSPQGSPHKKI